MKLEAILQKLGLLQTGKIMYIGGSDVLPAPLKPEQERQAVAALELPVTFELARLSLRVEEIAALAPGYTFALNGDASSVPVLLRIGGRIAARGRLVDVGGMPGVQITGMADAAGGSAEESANPESRAEGN